METRGKVWKEKDELRSYLTHINRDWWILKGQLIFGGVLLFAVIFFLLWVGE